jgi:hypothetical protein
MSPHLGAIRQRASAEIHIKFPYNFILFFNHDVYDIEHWYSLFLLGKSTSCAV